MMNEKIFEAIGGLEDRMIAETETAGRKRSGRVLRRTLLVAALVAGLAISAGAAPLIRNALRGGKVKTDDTAWFSATNPTTGESHELRRHEIMLDVELNENPPERIETFYILQIPEGFAQNHGYIYKDAMTAQYGWIPDSGDGDIFFTQTAGGAVQPEDLTESVFAVLGETPKTELRTFAGIQGYLIDVKTVGDDYGNRIFFWCEGDYLFRLEVPCDYTDTQLEELVASVQPVDDITPYLYSMTEQEAGELFG